MRVWPQDCSYFDVQIRHSDVEIDRHTNNRNILGVTKCYRTNSIYGQIWPYSII